MTPPVDNPRKFSVHDANLTIRPCKTNLPADKKRRAWGNGFQSPDYETFNRAMKVLEARGFTFGLDPRIDGRHPILNRSHRLGRATTPQGSLFVAVEMHPAMGSFQFFQEVVTVNRHGGRFDFDRVAKMPYLIRKKYEGSLRALRVHLLERGFDDSSDVFARFDPRPIGERLDACADPAARRTWDVCREALRRFNQKWDGEYERKRGTHRFARDEAGWPVLAERAGSHNIHDKDGVIVEHGEVRFARDRKGYLLRGRVFGGINGMWMFVYGPGTHDVTYLSSHELYGSLPAGRKRHPRPRPLPELLNKAVEAQNFERAIVLRDLIARAA